jgi:hypothetical protein
MAWWRIDPRSGETLGMGELPTGGGGGVEMVEYVLLYQGFAGTLGCLAISHDDPNGTSFHDIGVCGGTAIVSGLGPVALAAGGAALGSVIFGAAAVVALCFVTGFWLNTSPSLDKPVF